jgi:hypothetical protein
MGNKRPLPETVAALVVRTDFESEDTWKTICDLIRQPVHDAGEDFFAYVEFLDSDDFRDLAEPELLARVPGGYRHSFLFVVDTVAIQSPEFPILVIDLIHERGRTFRAIPSQIQGIENNLSIANMDFFEFADNVDQDGVFRGFKD